MAIVTDILDRRALVEIQWEGEPALRVRKAHFSKCPLEIGQDVEAEAYIGRMASIQFPEAYEAALSLLDYCARSAKELSGALKRRGYVDPVIEAVIQRLAENGLIDDARYALRMAELQSKKPVGVYAFKRKLRAKGISEEDAEEALTAFDDEQQQAAALAAAQKLYRKYESLDARQARARLSQALARRGFSWDAVSAAVDALMDDTAE